MRSPGGGWKYRQSLSSDPCRTRGRVVDLWSHRSFALAPCISTLLSINHTCPQDLRCSSASGLCWRLARGWFFSNKTWTGSKGEESHDEDLTDSRYFILGGCTVLDASLAKFPLKFDFDCLIDQFSCWGVIGQLAKLTRRGAFLNPRLFLTAAATSLISPSNYFFSSSCTNPTLLQPSIN